MEKAKNVTLFDTLDFFDQTHKQPRDRAVVKEFMKSAEYEATVVVVFKLLAELQNYKVKLVDASELIKNETIGISKVGADQNKKFNKLKKEYDDILTEFFDIIEGRREKELSQMLQLLDETLPELTVEEIAQMDSWSLFKKPGLEANEKDIKLKEIDSKDSTCSVKFQTDSIGKRKALKVIHFNDVYNIDERQDEPVSGYSRFYTAMRSFDNVKPLILFSGDIFAPSKLSIFFEGEHMMPFLKKAGIHCAWVGNHDFDYGDQKLGTLIARTDFPWLLSNLKRAHTGEMLSNTVEHVVLDHEGYKIALIGIAEVEWIEALNTLDLKELEFESPIDWAKRYVQKFKYDRDDIDFLIALTHMRTPRDIILGEEVPELDLILGGHDHQTVNHQPNNTLIRKSGTDFREFTLINLSLHTKDASEFQNLKGLLTPETKEYELESGVVVKDVSKFNIKNKTLIAEFQKIEVTSEFERNDELHEQVLKFTDDLNSKLDVIVGYTAVDLVGVFSRIRHDETNLSNLMADLVNLANKTDISIINAGTYRTDDIISKGFIKMHDIMNMLPMFDNVVVLKVPGYKIHKLLENGVSSYPEFQGKFPSISGIRFEFDASKEPYQRIDPRDINVQGQQLDLEKFYTVSAKHFMARGKDGYTDFIGWEELVDENNGIIMSNMLIYNLKMLEEKTEGEALDSLWRTIGNDEKELSPEFERNGEKVRWIMLCPKLDGRIKLKKM